jgi:hypothetical protein
LRLSGAATLIKMHNAPFYQTGCENFIRDMQYPSCCFRGLLFFPHGGQREEAKERRLFDLDFIRLPLEEKLLFIRFVISK